MADLAPASLEDIQYLRDVTDDDDEEEHFLPKPQRYQSVRGSIAWTPNIITNVMTYEPTRALHFVGESDDKSLRWKVIVIILGASLMAILAGITNAFNTFTPKIQNDLGLSDYFMSITSGLGLLGVNFVVPAGLLLDKFGPVKVGVSSTIIISTCFFFASFCYKEIAWLFALLIICIGFGSGGLFMSALGTSISLDPSGGGPGVSIVSACMSLSVAFVVLLIQVYEMVTGCTEDKCWRSEFQLFGVALLVLAFPGSLLLIFFKKQDFPHLIGVSSNPRLQITFWESLTAFKDLAFISYMISFFVAIGSSVLILLSATMIWDEYDDSSSKKTWPKWILLGYSLSNACCNVLCGLLSDYLSARRLMDQTQVTSIIQLIFGGVFLALGILTSMSHEYPLLYGALMICPGLGYGCYLVLYPVIIADKYGALNFGKYFAFLQFASTAAAFSIPQIALAVHKSFGCYTSIFYAMAAALFGSAFMLYGVPKLIQRKQQRKQLREYQILANTIN